MELFGKSWWGKMPCQLMVTLGKPGKQEFKCQEVFESHSFASLRWKMFVLKPENDQLWHRGTEYKVGGANLKVDGAVAPPTFNDTGLKYRKLHPCPSMDFRYRAECFGAFVKLYSVWPPSGWDVAMSCRSRRLAPSLHVMGGRHRTWPDAAVG